MSERQLTELARIILEHPEIDNLRERIHHRMFNKFRTASPDEREVINYIMDNEKLFFGELKAIAAMNENIGDSDGQD
jgi:hypothetical protein